MPLIEFEEIMKRDWVPVQLLSDERPTWTQNIPDEIVNSVFASGCINTSSDYDYQSKGVSSGELIGGFDIYRNAPDDPVELNKDWYAVLRCPDDPTMLLVDGPIKDRDHWLNEIPDRLNNVEILGVPKKPQSE